MEYLDYQDSDARKSQWFFDGRVHCKYKVFDLDVDQGIEPCIFEKETSFNVKKNSLPIEFLSLSWTGDNAKICFSWRFVGNIYLFILAIGKTRMLEKLVTKNWKKNRFFAFVINELFKRFSNFFFVFFRKFKKFPPSFKKTENQRFVWIMTENRLFLRKKTHLRQKPWFLLAKNLFLPFEKWHCVNEYLKIHKNCGR